MSVLTLIKYTRITVEDAELSVGAIRRVLETGHQAFVRKILAITRNGGRQVFPRKRSSP